MNEPNVPISKLQERVWLGDSVAYGQLHIAYLDERPEDFLFWAMLMANKYDYAPAYFDVFCVFNFSYNSKAVTYDLTAMDIETRKIALHYLKVAVDRNVLDAVHAWKDIKKNDSASPSTPSILRQLQHQN